MKDAYYGATDRAYDIAGVVQSAFDMFSRYEATNEMLRAYHEMFNAETPLPPGVADPCPGIGKFVCIICAGRQIYMGKEGDTVLSEMVR